MGPNVLFNQTTKDDALGYTEHNKVTTELQSKGYFERKRKKRQEVTLEVRCFRIYSFCNSLSNFISDERDLMMLFDRQKELRSTYNLIKPFEILLSLRVGVGCVYPYRPRTKNVKILRRCHVGPHSLPFGVVTTTSSDESLGCHGKLSKVCWNFFVKFPLRSI